MEEIKECSICRIKAVLLVYRQKKNLSASDKVILKEYEKMFLFLNNGYYYHTFLKFMKYGIICFIGFIIELIVH